MAAFNGWRLTRTGILFVVGIIVLAGLVFGGIYIVRDRGEQARRTQAIDIAEQNLQDQSQTAAQPATDTTPAAPSDNTETASTPAPTAPATAELPVTGPNASSIVIVSILALTAAFYVTSRRAVRDL